MNSRLALCESGPLIDLLQKISGEDGDKWTERLKKMLRGELDGQDKPKTFAVAMDQVYEATGLGDQYREAANHFDLTESRGFWKPVMVEGLDYANMVQAYQHFGLPLQTFCVDLQRTIDLKKEQRDPGRGSYQIRLRENMAADPANGGESFTDRRVKKCQDATALERLFVGLVVFLVTRQHLDLETWTLTSSLDVDGYVVGVSFRPDGGEVCVDCWLQGYANPNVRTRSAELSSS